MTENFANTTKPRQYFVVAWFRFPLDEDENFEAMKTVYDILVVILLLANPVLLWMTIKNPGRNIRTSSSVLIGNLCLVNMVVGTVGLSNLVSRLYSNANGIINYKRGAILTSIMLPKYYTSFFILSLIYYGMIVKPMRFKALELQKASTMIRITFFIWIHTTVIFIIVPFFVDDFDNYVKNMVTVVVSIFWFVTLVMVAMYIKILGTLRKRALALRSTFNMTNSRQGWVVTKQNQRLAKVLLAFIVVLTFSTLPIYTGYLFVLHCPNCSHHRANVKFCLYLAPVLLSMPIVYPFHWLLGTPQYYKELKRIGRRILAFCQK